MVSHHVTVLKMLYENSVQTLLLHTNAWCICKFLCVLHSTHSIMLFECRVTRHFRLFPCSWLFMVELKMNF